MTAYMALYLSIRDAITSGVYGYGAKLPSKRQTAEAQGVSLITVAHAYDLLVEEGYVEPRERSGYFVVFRERDNYGAADPRPMSRSMDIARTKTEQREAGERDLFPFPSLRARCAACFPRMEKNLESFAEPWLRRTAACDRILSGPKPPYARLSRADPDRVRRRVSLRIEYSGARTGTDLCAGRPVLPEDRAGISGERDLYR